MKKTIILFTLIFSMSLFSQSGDTVTTASGLKYIVVKNGKGKKSEVGKIAEVHYTGWLVDGKKFDSSRDRKQTLEFILGTAQIIKGWNEGVALMKVGDQFRFIIPPELAYGENGAGEVIPPDATLIFDIELINVFKAKKSIVDTLMTITMDEGVDKAIETYEELKYDYEDVYDFKETQLNILGYELLQAGKNKEAIKIFKLNVEQFPRAFNVYDSLGEAYMISGDKKLAIKNYEKSLKLNPDNDNAKKMLESLRSN
jgi:hypothetical protein